MIDGSRAVVMLGVLISTSSNDLHSILPSLLAISAAIFAPTRVQFSGCRLPDAPSHLSVDERLRRGGSDGWPTPSRFTEPHPRDRQTVDAGHERTLSRHPESWAVRGDSQLCCFVSAAAVGRVGYTAFVILRWRAGVTVRIASGWTDGQLAAELGPGARSVSGFKSRSASDLRNVGRPGALRRRIGTMASGDQH